jgi:hypothetical protein
MKLRGLEKELRELERTDPAVGAARKKLDETIDRIITAPKIPCGLCGLPVCRYVNRKDVSRKTKWHHVEAAHDRLCSWGYPLKPGFQLREGDDTDAYHHDQGSAE